jgi:Tfp pilus assembly protein PilF
MGSEKDQNGGRREERWRLLVLAAVILAVAAFAVSVSSKAPLSGKMDQARHAEAKRKEEVDRRFREGVAMLQAKQYEYALTSFHRLLQLAPEMPEAHVNAGYALLGMGQPKVARDFFETATNLRPNQLNAYFGLAEALQAMGDNFGALQAMETYVHLAPQDDPFRRKAEAAAWELRTKVDKERAGPAAKGQGSQAPGNGVKP